MLLLILPLLLPPVWGQDATQQACSDIMEEVMGKLDEFKVDFETWEQFKEAPTLSDSMGTLQRQHQFHFTEVKQFVGKFKVWF